MTLHGDIAVLAGTPLLRLLEQDALRLLAFAADSRSLEAGEVLFSKGDRSDGAYVVTSGLIALQGAGEGGQPDVMAKPGTLIGHAGLFLRSGRRATATARESSTVLHITPMLMRRVLEEFPRGAKALEAVLAEDVLALSSGLAAVRRRLEALDSAPSS